jgi:hypothetical protein
VTLGMIEYARDVLKFSRFPASGPSILGRGSAVRRRSASVRCHESSVPRKSVSPPASGPLPPRTFHGARNSAQYAFLGYSQGSCPIVALLINGLDLS